jgi:hypothetical protein
MTRSHATVRGPSSASAAVALIVKVSPTAKVAPAGGTVSDNVGVTFAGWTCSDVEAVAPWASRTVRVAVYGPAPG